MYASTWAMTKKSYKALQNCFSYVTYAAVGWGGNAWLGQWDVLLRSRTMAGDSKLPARCDTAIPDLNPGRMLPGITAVGYRLMVCGGWRNGYSEDNLCYFLDTNSNAPQWKTMTPMFLPRSNFQLITYGDAMFAIAGWMPSGTNQVDRWTLKQGWVNGSVNQVFKYTVSKDTWTGFAGLPWNRNDGGCGITYKRTDGHRWMIHAGQDYGSEVVFYDLTTNSGWVHYTNLQVNWARSRWISLTPYESYLAGGNNDYGESTR